MLPRAVLDACVLYPQSVRGIVLKLAERERFQPLWSARILEEAGRNLIAHGRMTASSFARMAMLLNEHWPEASVDGFAAIEADLPVNAKDRHVLAAAIRGRAQFLVTSNLRDFPAEACAAYGVQVVSPDDFTMHLCEDDSWGLLHALALHSFELENPHLDVERILEHLRTNGCTRIVDEVSRCLAVLPGGGPGRWYAQCDPVPSAVGGDADWFCVRTNAYPCPSDGCDFVAVTMTAEHHTLVWPDRDDPYLLEVADAARAVNRNPVVAPYEPSMGPMRSYYGFAAAGHHVHGVACMPGPADGADRPTEVPPV